MTETKEEKLKAQQKYANERGAPVFVPSNHCFSCRKDVYLAFTVKQAREELITGCPYCNTSFVG